MSSTDTEAASSNPFAILKDSIVIWWDDWTDWIAIGAIWVLCWLLIVFGPPATFGLYYVATELREGRATGVRGLIQGGKDYFGKSWVWMLVVVVVTVVLAVNYLFYGQFLQNWAEVIRGVIIVLGIIWVAVQFYTLPFMMIQEERSLRLAWKNSVLTILASPFHTLVILLVTVLIVVPSFLFFIPLFLGAQGLVAVLGSVTVEDRVQVFGLRERGEGRKRERGD